MHTRLEPAKYINGVFYFPGWELWDKTFHTPDKIEGKVIGSVNNIVKGSSRKIHHCVNGDHTPIPSCFAEKGHMSWCIQKDEKTGLPCGKQCRNNRGICQWHTLTRPFEAKNKQGDRGQEAIFEQLVIATEAHREVGQANEILHAEEPAQTDEPVQSEEPVRAGEAVQAEEPVGIEALADGPIENEEISKADLEPWKVFTEPEKPYVEKHEPNAKTGKGAKTVQRKHQKAMHAMKTAFNLIHGKTMAVNGKK
ncbi:hypothetical protein BLS_009477 [Venturia inaequalis]|uniref:Uncharacterized protein n=1 Tax=Venturia inaequalis TaxID=5025 RepID=A0A8H3U4T9_VENIN|nr:hypothetical protein BLS_009477 [Venturia inaequalis]